jgi:hypothetical protein
MLPPIALCRLEDMDIVWEPDLLGFKVVSPRGVAVPCGAAVPAGESRDERGGGEEGEDEERDLERAWRSDSIGAAMFTAGLWWWGGRSRGSWGACGNVSPLQGTAASSSSPVSLRASGHQDIYR